MDTERVLGRRPESLALGGTFIAVAVLMHEPPLNGLSAIAAVMCGFAAFIFLFDFAVVSRLPKTQLLIPIPALAVDLPESAAPLPDAPIAERIAAAMAESDLELTRITRELRISQSRIRQLMGNLEPDNVVGVPNWTITRVVYDANGSQAK